MIRKIIRKVSNRWNNIKDQKLLKELSSDEKEWIADIKTNNLTYLAKKRLASIVYSIRSIQAAKLKGAYIEAGCALGGSSILISKLKSLDQELNVYDVFGMIPPPTEEDTEDVHDRYKVIKEGKSQGLGGDVYYGYEENLYDKVISNFQKFGIVPEQENVSLIKGLVQETMNIQEPVVFAHIDVDWYEPVKTCLQQIWPNLLVGGCIILDDYNDWGGCKKATDEYFNKFPGQFSIDDIYGSRKVTKVH